MLSSLQIFHTQILVWCPSDSRSQNLFMFPSRLSTVMFTRFTAVLRTGVVTGLVRWCWFALFHVKVLKEHIQVLSPLLLDHSSPGSERQPLTLYDGQSTSSIQLITRNYPAILSHRRNTFVVTFDLWLPLSKIRRARNFSEGRPGLYITAFVVWRRMGVDVITYEAVLPFWLAWVARIIAINLAKDSNHRFKGLTRVFQFPDNRWSQSVFIRLEGPCWISNTIESWSRLRRLQFLRFDTRIGSNSMDYKHF